MAKTLLKNNPKNNKPFLILSNASLESDLFDSVYQIVMFVYLKKFADSNNTCFPSIKTLAKQTRMSVRKVIQTVTELEEKGILTKEHRTRSDGGKTSNLYILNDTEDMWNTGSNRAEDKNKAEAGKADELSVDKMLSQITESGHMDELIAKLNELGYIKNGKPENNNESSESTESNIQSIENIERRKEKEPEISTADQSIENLDSNTKEKNNQFVHNNNTSDSKESQASERYSLEIVREYYDYDALVEREPDKQDMIDSVFSILYTVLNTGKTMLRVNGHDMPAMAVVSKLRKLSHNELLYCIDKYDEQTDKIKNPTSYMLTLLYNAKEQMCLDIKNQVNHDYDDIMGQDETQYSTYDDFTIRKKKE